MIWIVVAIIALLVIYAIFAYNSLIRNRNQVENAWSQIDVQLKRRFKRVITLDELRKHESDALDGMLLLKRGNRLSITPVSDAHWRFILSLVERESM